MQTKQTDLFPCWNNNEGGIHKNLFKIKTAATTTTMIIALGLNQLAAAKSVVNCKCCANIVDFYEA